MAKAKVEYDGAQKEESRIAGAKDTHLKISNKTNVPMTIKVSEMDPYDWGVSKAADDLVYLPTIFNGNTIGSHSSSTKKLVINKAANGNMVELDISLGGEELHVRFDQSLAIKDHDSEREANELISAQRSGVVAFFAKMGNAIGSRLSDNEKWIPTNSESYTLSFTVEDEPPTFCLDIIGESS